jgi:hypothetical protein
MQGRESVNQCFFANATALLKGLGAAAGEVPDHRDAHDVRPAALRLAVETMRRRIMTLACSV